MQDITMPRAGGTVSKWLAICEQLPEILSLGELKALTTVYYPIALLRMKLEEYSFEDFNAVEQSMLRFYSSGLTSAEEICRWMALPSLRYVQERLALLVAEGLIENGKLTALGQESLQIGQKKKLYDAEQLFQADGITGILLPRNFQIKSDRLIGREFTSSMLPHLAHSDDIALTTIEDAIQGDEKIRQYKRYRKSILNVNVRQVLDVQPDCIKYTKALLVWPICSNTPMVFLPYYDRGGTENIRHCDMPLFIPASLSSKLSNLSHAVELIPDEQLNALIRLYDMIIAEQKRLEPSEIAQWFRDNTAFDASNVWFDSGRIKVELKYIEGKVLSQIDLELLAAMGSGLSFPVEVEMELTGGGKAFRKHLSVWPVTMSLPEEARQLAKGWCKRGHKVLRQAPTSLSQALQYISGQHNKEDD